VSETSSNSKAISEPFGRTAWLILPIAVHLVEINVYPDLGFHDALSPNAKRFRSLMQFLYITMHRFDGVKHVTKVIDRTIAAISETVQRLHKRPVSAQVGQSKSPETNPSLGDIKPQLLEVVVRTIRNGMAGEAPRDRS